MNPTLILIVGALAMIVVLIGILSAIGLSRMDRYRQDIIFLETVVEHWIISQNNYSTIVRLFADIERNDVDPERTNKAWNRFVTRFQDFHNTPQGSKRRNTNHKSKLI